MATEADLDGWGRMAKRHWLKFRPKAVAALRARGELYDALVEAQESAGALYEELIRDHTPPQVADELVKAEYIILPDWGEPGSEVPPEDLDDGTT